MSDIQFDDSVTAANLPKDQKFGIFYGDGAYVNEAEVRAQLGPDAILLGVTVEGRTGSKYNLIDCEAGNLGGGSTAETIARAVNWVAEQVKLGVDPLGVYADEDYWLNQGLLKELAHYGARIKRYDAAYDGSATIPSWADAHQYLGNVAPGVDRNIAKLEFFEKALKPKPAPKPRGTAHALVSLDLATGKKSIHHVPGTAQYEGKSFTVTVTFGEHESIK